MENYQLDSVFQIAFNMIRIPYNQLDEILTYERFIEEGNHINLCINIESVMMFISTIQDLENRLVAEPRFIQGFIKEFVNTVSHYKSFFQQNHFADTKIYLYYTSLDCTKYPQLEYVDSFRSYYINKYTTNPKFVYWMDRMRNFIYPSLRTILEYINNCYLIEGKDIDSSVIPMMISEIDPIRKNIIISADPVDTQYRFYRNFYSIYVKRNPSRLLVYKIEDYIKELTKNEDYIKVQGNPLLNNRSLYLSMIASVTGSKTRSIDNLYGIGYKSFLKFLMSGFKDGLIVASTKTPELIANVFPCCNREDFINNFKALDVSHSFRDLKESDKTMLKHQILDRFDNNGLIRLNNQLFSDVGPINVEPLLL